MKTIIITSLIILASLGAVQAASKFKVAQPLHTKYCVVSRTHKPPVTCSMHPESVVGSPCSCLVPDDGRFHNGIVQQTTVSATRAGQ